MLCELFNNSFFFKKILIYDSRIPSLPTTNMIISLLIRHTLLGDPESIGVHPNGDTYYEVINDNERLPYKIEQYINATSKSDNYFRGFGKSIKAVFFWTSGRWDQLEQWSGFWPVDVFSIIGGVLLVTILQNMLIAIMT
jgi:hypothetical protein